ncbi:MAG: DUF465 domain-containing protein [Thermodesulfovibrionales bacterium]
MTENDIVRILANENPEFRKLGEEHKHLEEMLSEFNCRVYLTPEEEMERKRIQKLKLLKKDKMAELIREYRKHHNN